MTVQDLGSIGELVAALATLATLVYLAIQIRQNTSQMERTERVARGQSYQQLLAGLQGHFTPVGYDEMMSSIFLRGMQDFKSLNELEQYRFNWILGGHMFTNDNAYYQMLEGTLSSERWEHLFKSLVWFFESPGVRQWWSVHAKHTLHPGFCALIDAEMEKYKDVS